MYKLVNKIQIGHSELLKLGKKLILRKTLIFIIFGLLFLDFRFYIDYDVIWVKIVHKHKPIYANYWFQWQKKYNIERKKITKLSFIQCTVGTPLADKFRDSGFWTLP